MTCYKFECSHLQDFLSSLNAVISTNESTKFITGHVIYNPAYTYKFQLKMGVPFKKKTYIEVPKGGVSSRARHN